MFQAIHSFMWCKEFKVMSWDISHLLQKIKGQKFSDQLKMSKYVSFFLFSSKPNYFLKFLSLQKIFAFFVRIFMYFFVFIKSMCI